MMIDNVTAVDLIVRNGRPRANYDVFITVKALAQDLIDARKELEETKKNSVWRDAPNYAEEAVVYFREPETMYFHSADRVVYKRTLPKTPKQELIDSFVERHSMAFRCGDLNKELLEAFVKEYEEMKK